MGFLLRQLFLLVIDGVISTGGYGLLGDPKEPGEGGGVDDSLNDFMLR